ncbi:MAG: hypothetical protein V3V30_03180 [Parvularculaceae bacterium]
MKNERFKTLAVRNGRAFFEGQSPRLYENSFGPFIAYVLSNDVVDLAFVLDTRISHTSLEISLTKDRNEPGHATYGLSVISYFYDIHREYKHQPQGDIEESMNFFNKFLQKISPKLMSGNKEEFDKLRLFYRGWDAQYSDRMTTPDIIEDHILNWNALAVAGISIFSFLSGIALERFADLSALILG